MHDIVTKYFAFQKNEVSILYDYYCGDPLDNVFSAQIWLCVLVYKQANEYDTINRMQLNLFFPGIILHEGWGRNSRKGLSNQTSGARQVS